MKLEFRIPISPLPKFYAQVRFFNYALRRLDAPHYRNARILVVVGDYCDIDQVRRDNRWSAPFDIEWARVPDAVFDEFHWGGTANWRLEMSSDADVIALSDADTVLLRDVDPALRGLAVDRPAVRGHMAHFPPPLGPECKAPSSWSAEFWPWLFAMFGLDAPPAIHRYSIDRDEFPSSPAYFNLGFVVMNRKALQAFGPQVASVTRTVTAATGSFMRCQIALTILAYAAGADIEVLPAEYNAANDPGHLSAHQMTAERIRVLHYLRTEEIDRDDLEPERIDAMLRREATNPANAALLSLAREFRDHLCAAQ